MSRVNFDQLLEAGVHFGHLKKKVESRYGSLYLYGAQWYSYH